MDTQTIESLVTAGAWFGMIWFASSGLLVIIMQALLPRAWKQIRAQPPHGPDWAYNLWYERSRVYGGIMTISLGLGLIAATLSFLFA